MERSTTERREPFASDASSYPATARSFRHSGAANAKTASSCANAEQVVKIDDADDFAGLDHQQRLDLRLMILRASAASASGAIVRGERVITSSTGVSIKRFDSRRRLRSPSVMIPASPPSGSNTLTQPKPGTTFR